jgi:hypothetical protein
MAKKKERDKTTPGSKPLFGEEKMEHRLIVVLTAEHAARMRAAAAKAHKSYSSWARDILLENAPKINGKENG